MRFFEKNIIATLRIVIIEKFELTFLFILYFHEIVKKNRKKEQSSRRKHIENHDKKLLTRIQFVLTKIIKNDPFFRKGLACFEVLCHYWAVDYKFKLYGVICYYLIQVFRSGRRLGIVLKYKPFLGVPLMLNYLRIFFPLLFALNEKKS